MALTLTYQGTEHNGFNVYQARDMMGLSVEDDGGDQENRGTKSLATSRDNWRKHHLWGHVMKLLFLIVFTLYGVYSLIIMFYCSTLEIMHPLLIGLFLKQCVLNTVYFSHCPSFKHTHTHTHTSFTNINILFLSICT